VIDWPRQSVPDAANEKGDVTDAPLTGFETTTLLVVELELVCTTLMFTFAVHDAPPVPHDFTCTVCAPRVAVTLAVIEAPLTIVVLELLSRE
jgi:hypothetical protein